MIELNDQNYLNANKHELAKLTKAGVNPHLLHQIAKFALYTNANHGYQHQHGLPTGPTHNNISLISPSLPFSYSHAVSKTYPNLLINRDEEMKWAEDFQLAIS
ncbi:34499_t:CDS:2 [Gigaspora margarita]|uniref:34499_t:CDS:1 n=1 Tax=Gigaspora margarita TaxID=4874 RepID=A0ABN7VII8_GIGMA|nr:34499_t:CDS:2 [Gigaspora margarita]